MKPAAFSLSENTSFLTIAAILQKIISALYFFVVSWVIGTEQTAAYFNVFAAIAVFTVVADFGMNNVLTREAAREPGRAQVVFSQALSFKIFFGFLALVSLGAAKLWLSYPGGSWALIAVAGVTLWFDSLRSLMYSYLRAHKNVRFESVGLVVAQLAVAFIGLILLALKLPLIALVGVFMVVSIGQTGYAIWCVITRAGGKLTLIYEARAARLMLREAVPFALAGIIAQIYAFQDSFIIHRYLSATDGGDWARAYKLVFAFQFIPVSLGASAYPVMSSAAAHDPGKIVGIIKRTYEYLLLIALPLMAGIASAAEPLFVRYVHKFTPSLPALTVLVWSLGFGFLWYIHGAVLNASRRQNTQTFFVGLACVLSIVINVFAVPRYGIAAAAWAAVISNVLLWILGYVAVNRFIPLPHKDLALQTLKIVGATACMVATLLAIRLLRLPALLLVPAGFVSYGIGLLVFKAVSKEFKASLLAKIPARLHLRTVRL